MEPIMNADMLRERFLTLRFEFMRRFGVAGFAAAAVLCVAFVVANGAMHVRRDTLDLLNEILAGHVAKHPHAASEATQFADAALLETLPDLFPPFARSADDIASILTRAKDVNLSIGSAEYVVITDAGGRYVRYQMLLPVKDQYGTIRRFIASVLNSVPNAALREIHVERPAVDGSVLDARVRFELVYGAQRP
jgi:hypothetical protein